MLLYEVVAIVTLGLVVVNLVIMRAIDNNDGDGRVSADMRVTATASFGADSRIRGNTKLLTLVNAIQVRATDVTFVDDCLFKCEPVYVSHAYDS